MNILPHKSWHVRTQKNIARVKKDQAKAAEEEKEIQRRIALAAQEARTSFLRERAGQRVVDSAKPGTGSSRDQDSPTSGSSPHPENEGPAALPPPSQSQTQTPEDPFALSKLVDLTQSDGHINFFQEIEDGKRLESGVNKDHEQEKQTEKEDYEKKIGLLVYLGQNSLEHSKDRPWYERLERPAKFKAKDPSASTAATTTTESDLKIAKQKDFHDPLKDIRMYLSSPGMKKKLGTPSAPTAARTSLPVKRPLDIQTPPEKSHKKKKKSQDKKHRKHSHKHKSKKSHKKHRKSSRSDSSSKSGQDSEEEAEKKRTTLAKLRAERLEREREEKRKADRLLATLRGETVTEVDPETDPTRQSSSSGISGGNSGRKQKYNSQFNPHLARQNFDDQDSHGHSRNRK